MSSWIYQFGIGIAAALVLVYVLIIWRRSVRSREPVELTSRSFRSMGGLAMVTLGAAHAERIETIAARVHDLLKRMEGELSVYEPGSAISHLAETAGSAPTEVSEDARRVLHLAQRFGELTDGAFDVTLAPVVRLWGFHGAPYPNIVPSEEAIREHLRLVDYRRIVLKDQTAFLPLEGMAVDLGGIAKGYAVDQAFELCRREGIRDFLIDLSGNIRVSGRPGHGQAWQVGIRNPFDRSRVIGKVMLQSGMALATSGNYERFVEVDGERYSHILDSRSGHPVKGTAGVTALCSDATTADALSTWFFVVGLDGAGKSLKKASPAEVLIVPDRNPLEIWVTLGFAKVFIPIPELSDSIRILAPTSS
jgi:thiamine biosynthesis lipoprotein